MPVNLVTSPDFEQRRQVDDIGPLDEHTPPGLIGNVVRQRQLPALDQHARLA
jgi:hypothetical protein